MMTYFLFHTVCLGAFWAFYQVFLKRDTFFERNRWYLLLSALFACVVPFLEFSISKALDFEQVPMEMREAYIINSRESEALPMPSQGSNISKNINALPSKNIWQKFDYQVIILWIYGLGVALALVLFVVRLGKLLWFIYHSPTPTLSVVEATSVKPRSGTANSRYNTIKPLPTFSTVGRVGTFSFFNYLFWDNSLKLSEKEEQQILAHEWAHIKGKHSYDLLFMGLQKIVFWFNPIIYLYENELRNQHEFIADQTAIKHSNPEDYASLMVSSFFKTLQIDFTHQFHNQQIKQRIKMLNTQKTSWIKGNAKTVLAVALVTMVAFAFACTKGLENNIAQFAEKNAQINAYQQELLDFEEKYPDIQVDVRVNEKGIAENVWHEPFSMNDVLNVSDEKDRKRIFQLSQELFKEKQKPFYPTQIDENGNYIFPEKTASFNDDLQKKGESSIVFQYPKDALPQKASGEVLIEFVVNKEGKTQDFKVIKPFYGKETALINYFQNKTYTPAMHESKIVSQKMLASMHYRFFDKNAKKEKYTMQGFSNTERAMRKMIAWAGGTYSANEQESSATITATKID
jgi:beta-lactamase regulating signal transducer with metallopeptidase domain